MSGLVSVVVPAFNRANFIEKSILSIFSQNYSNLECIVVDDGSTDNTFDVVKGMFAKHPSVDRTKLTYLKFDKNRGIPSALNMGYRRAKGSYLCQLSSDDYWHDRDKLSKQVAILESRPSVGLVYSDYVFEEIGVRSWNADTFKWSDRRELFVNLLTDCCMNACTFLMRRKFYNDLGEYSLEPAYEWNQDLHFNFRAALLESHEIVHMRGEYLATVTIHHGQASKQGKCGLGNDVLIPEMLAEGRRRKWI